MGGGGGGGGQVSILAFCLDLVTFNRVNSMERKKEGKKSDSLHKEPVGCISPPLADTPRKLTE